MQRLRLRQRMNGNGSQTLEQRIGAALDNDSITSKAIADLYAECEHAIAYTETSVTDANHRALDPTVEDAEAARQQRDDCGFRLERLKAALAPLQAHYSKVRLAERKAAWRTDYADVKRKRDATADKMKAIYTELSEKLIAVLEEAKQVDEEVARINSTAPNGEHDRLIDCECKARCVNAVGPNTVLSLMTDLKLPRFTAPGWAWPPPTPPILPEMVVPAKLMTHPGDNWAAHQQQAKAHAESEAKRVANYYRNQTREREERDNAAARSAQARRQST